MQALREGMGIKECAKRFDVSEKTARRYLKKVKEAPKAPKPPPQTKTTTTGGALAAVTAKSPAPILFTLGDVQIPLNPQYVYDAYLYYRDIQRIDPGMDDEFSLAIKVAMKHIWEKFTRREADRIGLGLSVREG